MYNSNRMRNSNAGWWSRRPVAPSHHVQHIFISIIILIIWLAKWRSERTQFTFESDIHHIAHFDLLVRKVSAFFLPPCVCACKREIQVFQVLIDIDDRRLEWRTCAHVVFLMFVSALQWRTKIFALEIDENSNFCELPASPSPWNECQPKNGD